MRDEEDDAPSGGGSASPGIDEDPKVLVTEWDVLADNMALMYQDAAEHAPAHAGSAPQNGAAGSSIGAAGGGGGGGDMDRWSEVRRGARPSRSRGDDDRSVASADSTFSNVSCYPTGHAARRIAERAITEDDIRRTKARGKMSLSIHLNGEEDTNDGKDEINWWVGRLKEELQQLEVGDVIEKGKEDRRVQVELRGSENRGPEIKEWLKGHNYFREKHQQSTDMKEWLDQHGYSWEEKVRPHRLLFTLRRGEKEVVVVEGRSEPDKVGVITVFGAQADLEFSDVGLEFDTKDFAVHFYNKIFCQQLLVDLKADALALDAALTLQGRARIDAASGFWVIGPVTTPYPLSTWPNGEKACWPQDKPFLLQAARHGRADFVERLTRQYKCDVNHQDLDRNTALHHAAYYGHADVVATLLDSGLISDLNLTNKYGETALDCARASQKAYDNNEFKGPKWFTRPWSFSYIDFTTRDGWPGWGVIIPRLEAASVETTQ